MRVSHDGSLGKAFIVLNFQGERIGLVIELTEVRIDHHFSHEEVEVRGILLQRVAPDAHPDIDAPRQLGSGTPQLPK